MIYQRRTESYVGDVHDKPTCETSGGRQIDEPTMEEGGMSDFEKSCIHTMITYVKTLSAPADILMNESKVNADLRIITN